jgi:hypothetical protein
VIHRRECGLHSDLLAKILEHWTVKVLYVVNCNVSGDTIVADDILPKEFFGCCRAYIGERLHLYPLCEVFNCHNDKCVIALCWGLLANDINAPSL